MDQVTAVKHALLGAQYVALAERTQFPVELLQQMAEECGYDLQLVEQHIRATMRRLADDMKRETERGMFSGGNAGGGKSMALRVPLHYSVEVLGHSGIVLTCTA